VFWVGGVWFFTEIMPVGFVHFNTVVFGCSFDVGKGLFALVVGNIFHLVEAGDGVADVGGVVKRLFALLRKGVDRGRKVVTLFGVESVVVLVVFPGCFHIPSMCTPACRWFGLRTGGWMWRGGCGVVRMSAIWLISRYAAGTMKKLLCGLVYGLVAGFAASAICLAQDAAPAKHVVVLHAARMLDVAAGKVVAPGEVLVEGETIVAVGPHVERPAGAERIDLGDVTLMPGLIDAHVHLFLHPGAEDLQTVQESVPERTLIAAGAAKADLMAGFTAERDMGTEGAGCADVAVRNAINSGLIPGPRMRMSCNAIDLTGGHEDAIGYNPAQRVLSNADYADSSEEIVKVMREQRKGGADFTKVYETGRDLFHDGRFETPYQYTEAELAAAVKEAERTGGGAGSGRGVAVHATGEPGTGFAVAAGVASVDHAYQLSDATMKAMKEKQIYAVPTFAIAEYFAEHAATPARAEWDRTEQTYHAAEFKKQLAAGVPMAVGSDVGPFPHGTQARELELMVEFGMKPAAVLQADLLNGARLLGWAGKIGELKAGYFADVIAVPGDPLVDISATTKVLFVMKNGVVYKRP
jgi:imidazolonepropionase-like amidohydrolase